jgi:hypothetical protein
MTEREVGTEIMIRLTEHFFRISKCLQRSKQKLCTLNKAG